MAFLTRSNLENEIFFSINKADRERSKNLKNLAEQSNMELVLKW